MFRFSFAFSAVALCIAGSPAHAAYVVNYVQSGADVVATGTGALNVTALTSLGSANGYAGSVLPGLAFEATGVAVDGAVDQYNSITGPNDFGFIIGTLSDSATGPSVGILGSNTLAPSRIYLPAGYISGSDLGTSTATYLNRSIGSLGLRTGSYVYSLGSGVNADTFTVNIGSRTPPSASVPEPRTWALMLLGFGIVGATLHNRRKVSMQDA